MIWRHTESGNLCRSRGLKGPESVESIGRDFKANSEKVLTPTGRLRERCDPASCNESATSVCTDQYW